MIFDVSSEVEAKKIATCIRILLHDTNSSHSLLGQMNEKFRIKFIDSCTPNDGRLHSMTGMKGVKAIDKNQYFGLVAKVNELGTLIAVPFFTQHLAHWYSSYEEIEFNDWWGKVVISIEGQELRRKDLILTVANKDGGAHVDRNQPENYRLAKVTPLSLDVNDTDNI